MLSLDFKKQILPHLIAVLVFLLVCVLFFAPVFFEGKSLTQHDVMQGLGGGQEAIEYRDQTGEEALWTNSMFGGMPAYLVNTVYSGDLMRKVLLGASLGIPRPANLIFLTFLSFYILLLAFRVRPWLAISGALAFGLTSFMMISLGAGHNSKVEAVAFMPLVLAGVHLSFDGRKVWGFIVTALGLGLELAANHLQMTYYLLLIILVYGLVQLIFAIKEKGIPELAKTVGLLVVAVVLAVGANFGKLWTVYEYSQYSIRGKSELTSGETKATGLDKDYAFQYSNGITEPLVLFIPNFFGGSLSQDLGKNSNLEEALLKNGIDRRQTKNLVENAQAYWGKQPGTAPYYAGAIVVFLFVLAMFVMESKHKYWLLAMVVLSIVLSWGKNFEAFNYFFFDYFPGYNKFRSITFVIIIAILCLSLGGFLGLEKLLSQTWNKKLQKQFLIALGITGGFALLSVILAGIGSYRGSYDDQMPEWYVAAIQQDRVSLLRMDALRSLFFVLAAGAVVWFYFKNKLKVGMAAILIGLLVCADMFLVAKRFVNSDSYARSSTRKDFAPSEADQTILQDRDPNYRVYNLINGFNDARTSYHHKSIGGYHGAKMRRYQDLIEHGITKETSELIEGLQSGRADFSTMHIINMLNAKYMVAGNTAAQVIANPNANGNAWFVNDIRKVGSADEEIETLNTINTKTVAVIDTTKFSFADKRYSASNIIQLLEYKPNYLKYEATCFSDGLAVFSEIYYPEGWVAKIDSAEVDILRANYVLRALEIPEGTHIVDFEFKPKSYFTGNTIMWISSIVILLLFVGGLYSSFFGKKEALKN